MALYSRMVVMCVSTRRLTCAKVYPIPRHFMVRVCVCVCVAAHCRGEGGRPSVGKTRLRPRRSDTQAHTGQPCGSPKARLERVTGADRRVGLGGGPAAH